MLDDVFGVRISEQLRNVVASIGVCGVNDNPNIQKRKIDQRTS